MTQSNGQHNTDFFLSEIFGVHDFKWKRVFKMFAVYVGKNMPVSFLSRESILYSLFLNRNILVLFDTSLVAMHVQIWPENQSRSPTAHLESIGMYQFAIC